MAWISVNLGTQMLMTGRKYQSFMEKGLEITRTKAMDWPYRSMMVMFSSGRDSVLRESGLYNPTPGQVSG